ncbi:MAG TPA: aspartyl protease family protein [Gemmatimonadaceae bacterium]|nr:aspartyl protease family protein [Gemmatimonadaceae bacterium]
MLSIPSILALAVASVSARPPVTVTCAAPPVATTALPATLPVDVWNNHIYVKVCIAGRELDFILDTGAGSTSLDLNTARQLGVGLGQTLTVGGAGAGRVEGARIQGASVTLAGTSITQPVVLAIDLSRLPPREAHRMDGILGDDFIERNVLAIDYARRELRIYDRDSFHYDGPGTAVPLTLINRFPHIDAAVKLADGETVPGRFVIDVGSGAALSLAKPFVDEHRLRERVGPTIRRSASGGIGGMTTTEFGRVATLSIGSVDLSRPVVQLYGDSAGVFSRSGPWVGNIGGAILRRFTLFLDYHAKRMIFEPNGTFNEPFEADMSGAALVMDDSLKTIIVDRVEPSSPASEAGLERGDVVVAVDGAPAGQRELGELRERRFRRPGEHVRLTVRRGTETKEIEIVTRRLVANGPPSERRSARRTLKNL